MELLKYPDPRLKIVCDSFEFLTEANVQQMHDLLDDMWRLLAKYGGYGLAAPQVGAPIRAIIVHPPKSEKIELINPEIERLWGGQFMSDEGCLSWPGQRIMVKRFRRIKVRGLNRHGESVVFGGKMLRAAALQHELDHLIGINLADHAGLDWETEDERENAGNSPQAEKPAGRRSHLDAITDPAIHR